MVLFASTSVTRVQASFQARCTITNRQKAMMYYYDFYVYCDSGLADQLNDGTNYTLHICAADCPMYLIIVILIEMIIY